jgi:hypothetical protein
MKFLIFMNKNTLTLFKKLVFDRPNFEGNFQQTYIAYYVSQTLQIVSFAKDML